MSERLFNLVAVAQSCDSDFLDNMGRPIEVKGTSGNMLAVEHDKDVNVNTHVHPAKES